MIPESEMPEAIRKLPRERGFPKPFFASDDLRLLDREKVRRCHMQNLCFVCGEPLSGMVCFIGGEKTVAGKVFIDGPMHQTCAEFSMKYCPFLNGTSKKYRDSNLPEHHERPGFIKDMPERFGMVFSNKWEFKGGYFHVKKTIKIRWYKDGLEQP